MKLEERGMLIEEFIGLRSKCYTLCVADNGGKTRMCYEENKKKLEELYMLARFNPWEYEQEIKAFDNKSYVASEMGFHDLEIKRIKGVSRPVVANEYTSEDFRNCVLTGATPVERVQTNLLKRDHRIWTREVLKQAFTVFDDKKYILDDGNVQKPFGHPYIKILKSQEVGIIGDQMVSSMDVC